MMIEIERLHHSFGKQQVFRDLNLDIPDGQLLALIGPSGTGKSVLLKDIVGLLRPDRGDVRIDGVSVPGAGSDELARLRRGMGYVFQDAALLDSFSVRDNLRLALDDCACESDPTYCPCRIEQALETVNLNATVLEKRPTELSGGMRKRIGVARALMNDPKVLLYDEPTSGLDPQNVAAINEAILQAHTRRGATSLVVTHDLGSVEQVAERVVLLQDGRIRFDGSVDEFFSSQDPAVEGFRGGVERTALETA